MNQTTSALSRRDALIGAMALAAGLPVLAPNHALGQSTDAHNDFAFLSGSWSVRHHKLKSRLTGETQWWDFGGTCRCWPLLGGGANIDDNVLHAPTGTYAGVTLRRRDPHSGRWSIWWLDDHGSGVEPPVIGGFKDGVGTFHGEDQLRGRPILVRFIWSHITERSARWEQAFSGDIGMSWETNWTMRFEREA
jgi:hypothetical protein